MHAPHIQSPWHVCVPPHAHPCICPGRHAKPSSMPPTQLSSMPLHTSGALQVDGQAQLEVHVCVPGVSQLVIHVSTSPARHWKPLSIPPTQSSSAPLHVSAGGMQAPSEQS